MTKIKAKRAITKASTSKTSATKTSTPTSDDIRLLVLGFDEQQKPCGARFIGDKPDLVAKAAELMGLKVYKASSPGRGRCCQEAADRAALRQRPRVRAERAANALQRGHCRAWRPNRSRPRSARTTTSRYAGRPRPAADLGRDRAWPSRHRPREPRKRVVGGDRPSTATTTCSRCGFATTRSCPSSFGTAAPSR